MLTCILLAAGTSQRFGSPKALAPIFNSTVIEHLQETLLSSYCDNIIIVLGAHASLIEPYIFLHPRIRIVYNKDYNFGQTSSIQTGLKFLGESSGFILWPVDCPLIKKETVNELIAYFNAYDPDILVPTYEAKKGHPPIFSHRLHDTINNLPSNLGLNTLFHSHLPKTVTINDAGITKSFNTPEELKIMKDLLPNNGTGFVS